MLGSCVLYGSGVIVTVKNRDSAWGRAARSILSVVIAFTALLCVPGGAHAAPAGVGDGFVFPAVEVEVPGVPDVSGVGEGVFVFDLARSESSMDAPLPADTSISITVSPRSETEVFTGVFGPVEFTTPGEYHYQVSVANSGAVSGWVMDPLSYEVTVIVRDNGTGLSAWAYKSGSDVKVAGLRFTATPHEENVPSPEPGTPPEQSKDHASSLPVTGATITAALIMSVLLGGVGMWLVLLRRHRRQAQGD